MVSPDKNIVQPWHLGINHTGWRPFQYEAIQKILDIFKEKRIAILEAPTGTGKTAIATAVAEMGNHSHTTVVVQNLGLLEQYKDYGFAILKGKQAYPCADDARIADWKRKYNKKPTAADCPYAEMYQCASGKKCPYMKAREKAINSRRMACTYKYAALSAKVQDRDGLFVMDEIHNAVSEILGIGSFTMNDFQRDKFDLPEFPLRDYKNSEGGLLEGEHLEDVMEWIMRAMRSLGNVNLFDEVSAEGAEKKKQLERFKSLLELLAVCKGEIFYKCSRKEIWNKGKRNKMYEIEFKTVSPSYLYYKMSSDKDNILMMSATVGSPSALIAGELRIARDNYSFVKFPHPVPVSKRPIFDISVAPMSYSNLKRNKALFDLQAGRISWWIKEYTDPAWRGIVLAPSYEKIKRLRDGLAKYVGEDRIFENTKHSLQERIDEFMEDGTPSMIHVDTIQGWGTGVDLRGDIARYCVVAGVPFINPTDAFEKIRLQSRTGQAYATAYAYNAVSQAAGRVSRGIKRDGHYLLNLGALADKMATSPRAMSHYSDWFRDAIVKTDL